MTTDASPINRYLLFDRCDSFRANDKVTFALHAGRTAGSSKEVSLFSAPSTPSTSDSVGQLSEKEVSKRFLVRTLDEVKRLFTSVERLRPPLTPSTDATPHTMNESVYSSPELGHLHHLSRPAEYERSPALLDDNDDLDTAPWDNPGAQATYWNWPIETLYQRYHLVLAIDFGESTFDVSTNGEVFADRIPSVISSLFSVVETTLRGRDKDVAAIKAWLWANVGDEAARGRVLAHTWDPAVLVSIALINAPKPVETALPFIPSRHCGAPGLSAGSAVRSGGSSPTVANDGGGSDGRTKTEVPIFPPSHTRFAAFDASGGADHKNSTICSAIPILTRVDARQLMGDPTVEERLRDTLIMYENTCRERAKDSWPKSNLSATLEYLISTAPEPSAECHSIVLTTNTRTMTCSDTLSFLESVVRRKNLILSVVTLNRLFSIDSPHLSPLTQFLSAVGGFAVQLDYWLALAAPRLNSDWCHRFEGGRCLAQQLFVHLINHFPVAFYGVTQRHAIAAEHTDRVALLDSEKGLPDFVTSRSTLILLRAIATACFNEGWSVLMDYKDESTAGHLVARCHHYFHRGTLVLHYEMDINRPAVYRRLLVSGTRALVDHFTRVTVEDAAVNCFSEATGSWLTYLGLLRLKVQGWMRAEQAMLELLNIGPRTTPPLGDLADLSAFSGVMAEWLNNCTIASVGLFMRHEDVPPHVSLAAARNPSPSTVAAFSPTAAGRALVRQTMLQRHRQIGADEELTFVLRDAALGEPFVYVAQFFPFHTSIATSTGSHTGDITGIADGFECRVSFLLCGHELQHHLLQSLVDSLLSAARQTNLQLTASLDLVNQQSLLLVVSAVSPRQLQLLSYYTEHLGPAMAVGGRASPWGRSSRQQQGSPLSRPPLGRAKSGGGCSPLTPGPVVPPEQILPRALRSPYVTYPWSLANARSFKWAFACEDRFDKFGEEAFGFFIMRRVHAGFGMLVCYNGCLKAVMHRQVFIPGAPDSETVNVFDLIEGVSNTLPPSSRPAPASAQRDTGIALYRLTTPYTFAHNDVSTQALIQDVAEDVHVATALYSYKVFSSRANGFSGAGGVDGGASAGGWERRPAILQAYRREGKTVIKARMESLLPYLQPAHTIVLKLKCPRTLGPDGCTSLRSKMAHLATAMGDRHITTPLSTFSLELLRHLGQLSADEASPPRDRRMHVSLLFPIRYSTVTFIMLAERSSEASLQESVVKVAIGFLDAPLLHYGLVKRYSAAQAVPRMPECCPDTAVISSVQHMLTSFASIYAAHQLIGVLTSVPSAKRAAPVNAEEAMRELAGLYGTLDTFVTEVDATHLLRARLCAREKSSCDENERWPRAAVQEVIATLCCLEARSFLPYPAMFIPTLASSAVAATDSTAVDPAASVAENRVPAWLSAEACGNYNGAEGRGDVGVLGSALPMSFACCVNLESREEATGELTRECFWVSSLHANPSAVFGEATAQLGTQEDALTTFVSSLPVSRIIAATRMTLRVFVKTVPCGFLDLCCSAEFLPPPPVVRSVLRTLLYRYSPTGISGASASGGTTAGGCKGFSGKGGSSTGGSGVAATPGSVAAAKAAGVRDHGAADALRVTGKDGSVDVDALDRFFRRCHDFAMLPESVERTVRLLVVDPLVIRVAAYALYCTFRMSPFLELQRVIEADPDGPPPLAERARDGGMPLLFTQSSVATCRRAVHVEGLRELLRDIVDPALRSSPAFRSAFFPVEFTQQATNFRSVDPKAAALDVFLRCADEDRMCVLAAAKECDYAFVPNARFFGRRWILVQMDIKQELRLNEASIYYYDAEPPTSRSGRRSPTAVSNLLRTHIYTKITQISQLHLLKQLRETQYASAELIPCDWGQQFSEATSASSAGRAAGRGLRGALWTTAASSGTAGAARGISGNQANAGGGVSSSNTNDDNGNGGNVMKPSTSFYLRGTDALRIPIYYKLQQNCRRTLNFITTNSTRLELFQIYDREQCFVVADDEEGDTFHYIRLVFVKDLGHEVSPFQPSPRLKDTDRCPEMVVQLFTATSNASIRGPLRKLQDFCYLLAVQELQGHLNYVNSISFNDLVFLQNQLLSPITIDVKDHMGTTPSKSDVQLALSLLFLNLRENKFKLLDFQDGEQSHTKSVFVTHYLKEGPRGAKSPEQPPQNEPVDVNHDEYQQQQQREHARQEQKGKEDETTAAASNRQRTMRFVKVVDGSTDVLCSCALRWLENPCEPGGHALLLDRYLTKVPSERYINGESERAIMKQLSDLVEDTKAQLAFHSLSRAQTPSLPIMRVPDCCDRLLTIAERVTSAESSLLRYKAISLDDVSVAVFPYLVERLCGAVHLFSPRCCEGRAGRPHELRPLSSFPWAWVEAQQNDPTADEREVYIMCGYNVGVGDPTEAVSLAETHVLPHSLPELSMASTTTEEHQMSALKEQGLSAQGRVMPLRLVIRVSLLDGLCVGAFNMRDSDYLIRLLVHIVKEMEEKSALLRDVLLQRLGLTMPSQFNEADLARNCCGDATNVLQSKALSIVSDAYRRRVNNVRFGPRLEESADDLVVVVEGLYNRGLIVNYVFPAEDAVAVLFNERPRYTLANCERVIDGFLRSGIFVRDEGSALRPQVPLFRIVHGKSAAGHASFNCRLVEVAGVPADALIACDYHRHVLAAHIILEAQNARSEVAEVLAQCDALWRAGPQENVLGLAKAIVTLQMKSKQVFGSRLPDFSLRRERWSPDDDVLDPTLPTHAARGPSLSATVDDALRCYMRHLRQLYPAMCIIDLDPADPVTTGDEVLLNRLRCRYGKVTNESGAVMRFGTHLYYAVIPFVDLIRCKTMHERYGYVLPMLLAPGEESAAAPITTSGLFVVEIGFQVVHYALDFFVVNGGNVPMSVAARVAADFKQSLMFDSILYDASVQHVQERIRAPYGVDLAGYVDVLTAVANLVKYYPSPPASSVNIASVFRITDPRVMRLRNLPQAGSRGGGATARGSNATFIHLVPERGGTSSLLRARTGPQYLFCGLIAWETAQLYVLLSCEAESARADRAPNEDLSNLVQQAKRLLLAQLLESTQQERLDAAWEKFLCNRTPSTAEAAPSAASVLDGDASLPQGGKRKPTVRPSRQQPLAKDLPSYDEFELLRNHCQRVVLQSYRNLLQSTVCDVEWVGDVSTSVRAARVLFPDCAFRVLWKPSRTVADIAHTGVTGVAASASATAGACPTGAAAAATGSGTDFSCSREHGGGCDGGSAPTAVPAPPGFVLNSPAPTMVGDYDVSNLFASNGVPGRVIFTLADRGSAGIGFLGMECWSVPGGEPSFVVEDISFFRKSDVAHPELSLVTTLTQQECDLLQKFLVLISNALWSTIIPCSSQIMI